MPWECRKFNYDDYYNELKPEGSHYLICSNCGHVHVRYVYNVWTNTITACKYGSGLPEVPVFCSQCGEKMLENEIMR